MSPDEVRERLDQALSILNGYPWQMPESPLTASEIMAADSSDRDALRHLLEWRSSADKAAYCGVKLTRMTNDELLSLAAVLMHDKLNEWEKQGRAFRVPNPEGPQG